MLATLDIAIGLVLVFSCVSLVCSILNEWLSGILAMRGRLLWQGIETMLTKDLRDQVCRHHLIQSLVRKSWFDTLWPFNRSKPAYVPTQTFTLALLDVLGWKAQAAPAPGAPAAAAPAPAPPAPAAPAPAAPAPAAANVLAPVGGAMPTTIQQLLASVQALDAGSLRNGLKALVDAAGTATGSAAVAGAANQPAVDPLEIARQNIGQWYDSAMDRVTGAYKRWSQLALFVIGLLVATLLGIDAKEITKALQANPELRAAAVQAAQSWVRQHPEAAAKTGGNAAAKDKVTATPVNPGTPPPPPAAGSNPATTPAPQSLDAVKSQLDSLRQKLAGLDIPLSPWDQDQYKTPWDWLGEHLLGFLLTALAASLGAPFWFDLLNRFVSLRSAGKKPEPQAAAGHGTTAT